MTNSVMTVENYQAALAFTHFRDLLARRLRAHVLADLQDEIRVDVSPCGDGVRIITWGDDGDDTAVMRIARKVCAPDRAVLAFVERDSWVVYVHPRPATP